MYENITKTNGKLVLGRGTLDSPKILFLGEAPGKTENKEGRPFVGRSGKILDKWIEHLGIKTFAITNAIPIIPLNDEGKIRKPTPDEIAYFRPHIKELIDSINPDKIIIVGKTAAECFQVEFRLGEWQGKIGCIYHPAYYLRQGANGISDLEKLFKPATMGDKVKKVEFKINKQVADNLGHSEMINGVLAGLHEFARQANIYFKDINTKDECEIGEQICRVYTRDAQSDDDMVIKESYFQEHPEIQIFITCRIKGGDYNYVGYVTRETVETTRLVQMTSTSAVTQSSGDVRLIFAETYKPMNDIFEIYESATDVEEIAEPQGYVPLHLHSEYSVLDAYGTIPYIAESLRRKGFAGAALTDHGTLGGIWQFQKALLAKGLKPILGVEAYVKIPETDKRMHMTLLVKNQTGYQNLLKLQASAVRNHFYYKPIIPFEELIKNKEGLVVLSGCVNGIVPTLVRAGEMDMAKTYLDMFKAAFNSDFYVELMITTVIDAQKTYQTMAKLAKEREIKMVFTTDSHYPYKEDKKYHDAVTAVGRKKSFEEGGYGDDCFYLMSDEDIDQRIKENELNHWLKDVIKEAKKNTFEVLDKCSFEITPPVEDDTMPKIYPTAKERKARLTELCLAGLERVGMKYEGKIKERMDYELNRILEKNYENYFLIVYDMIKWSKENGIMCGVGRGSVGASLVSYVLNITEVNPMDYDFLFDRFLSEIRRDMVDIDMDFQDSRRHEVFDYLIKKYGRDHCAKVVTYARYHPKGVLRDIGRIFSIPISEIEKVCGMVLERSGGDARASFSLIDTFSEFESLNAFRDKYPEAVDIAIKLEGHIRHCVDGEARVNVLLPDGKCRGYKIKNLYKKGFKGKIRSYDFQKDRLFFDDIVEIFPTGSKETIEIFVRDKSLKLTKNHLVLTKSGWLEAGKLKAGDYVAVNGKFKKGCVPWNKGKTKSEHQSIMAHSIRMTKNNPSKQKRIKDLISKRSYKHGRYVEPKKYFKAHKLCEECKEKEVQEVHHIDGNWKNNGIKNLKAVCISCHRKLHGTKPKQEVSSEQTIFFSPIKKIIDGGKINVYDIEMKSENHNFICNKMVVHNCGQHAAALIVTERDISTYLPIGKVSGEIVTQFEKFQCEDLKLIKFDILGLKTLTVINETLQDTGAELPRTFDDERVYKEVFQTGHTLGVFQFETVGLSKMAKTLKIDSFNVLYDTTTLFRPGCVSRGTKITKNQPPDLFKNNEIGFLYKAIGSHGTKILEEIDGKFVESKADIINSGEKELFRLVDEEGNFIDVSANHKFLTDDGWKKLSELKSGNEIYRAVPEKDIDYVECVICNKKRKNLARNHLTSHGIKPSEYFSNLFTKSEEKRIKQLMSNMGKRGFVAQQKTLPYKELQKLGVKACKTKTARKNNSIAQKKNSKKTSERRKKFLKENPDKHPAVILAKNGNISYMQKKMYNIIKKKYPTAKLEVPIPDTTYCADVFISEYRLIVEYDGKYWHSTEECIKKDKKRDKELAVLGFETIRIRKSNFKDVLRLIDEKVQS